MIITYKGWRDDNFSVPNDVYVGGSLFSSILDVPYQQVKIVAKSGAPYSTITAAQTAITDNSSSKIYTVLVFPGEYDEALTLKDYVNIIAIDQFNTYILRQVTDNGVPVHCNLKINIDNRQTDVPHGTHGLYLTAASVIHIEGNVKGGNSTGSGGKGIYNYSAGIVKVLNGNVTGGIGGVNGGEGIYNYSTGTVTVINGNATGGNGDMGGGKGIYNYSTGTITILNGNAIGGIGGTTGGRGIENNYSANTILVKNGYITNPGMNANHYPIWGGNIILIDCIIVGNHADVPAIYLDVPKTVKCMNVWSNRDLHSNITNLIPGGFNVNSNVSLP
jgi:hypothetical protein